jgi:uncharacterized protein YlzI (FlbEa/FlbD family)
MIKLTSNNGSSIWVNPDMVILVRDKMDMLSRTGNSFVTMISGEHFEVKCYAEVVVKLLAGE